MIRTGGIHGTHEEQHVAVPIVYISREKLASNPNTP